VDVRGLLLRAGTSRPHVLVAALPGATPVRLAAEDLLRRRGWPAARNPAEADILLVAGTPGEDIGAAVEAAWAAVPAPRARVSATTPGAVATALDAARGALASVDAQRAAAPRGGPASHRPVAERGQDRDGLALDRLHVPLGPLLPDWPAGLVVRVTLQGDVVQQAEARFLGLAGRGADAYSFWNDPWRRAAAGQPVTAGQAARRRAAARLDSLGRFLAVAGWDDAAGAARTLRDELVRDELAGGGAAAWLDPRLAGRMRRLAGRVARSRVLAWSTRGLGTLTADQLNDRAERAVGDVTDRYLRHCADVADLASRLDDAAPLDSSPLDSSVVLLDRLPGLLEGTELAAARLIIASLDPDPDELTERVPAGHGHGR